MLSTLTTNQTVMKKIILVTLLAAISQHSFAQNITNFAGTAVAGYGGDGGPASAAQFNSPGYIIYDHSGNLIISDWSNNRIRKISTSGIITTIAGTGAPGSMGDGGPATAAQLYNPAGMAVDGSGNIYFSDYSNQAVRKISPSGIITKVAGTGVAATSGDGGPATAAGIHSPHGIAFDTAGNLYISEYWGDRIRMISPSGVITTVAGTGVRAFSGDLGMATAAEMNQPVGLTIDNAGNIYFADQNNQRVRKIDAFGIISTFAGTGSAGYLGDGAAATAAKINTPNMLSFDRWGNLFIGDQGNNVVRKVSPSGTITTFAGTGVAGHSGDGGPATAARLNVPGGMLADHYGNLFLNDVGNNCIRRINAPLVAGMIGNPGSICLDSCITLINYSTGTTDSIRWSVPGMTVTTPHNDTVSVCFHSSGNDTVHLYVYGSGGADSTMSAIIINPAPHPAISFLSTLFTIGIPGSYTSYQWYHSYTGYPSVTIISGATSNTYDYTGNWGYFEVIVDSVGMSCSGTATLFVRPPDVVKNVAGAKNQYWLTQDNSILNLYSSGITNDELNVTIYDATGRKMSNEVWPGKSSSIQIDCSFFPSGLYIIKLSNADTSVMLKWLK